MDIFRYNTQTACFCGVGCVSKNAQLFSSYGKRAAVITSRFADGCRNYALEDVEAVFSSEGMEYIVIDDVKENPPVESVAELAAKCISFGAEFLVAIGGGSSIDSAKAISLIMKYPETDPYEVFYGSGSPSMAIRSESDIPVFAIPTTAGTGAEVTGFAVLTRSDTDTKLSMYPVVFCVAAFLDPTYIRPSPLFLLHSGAMDTLAHGVETYLHVGSNFMNRSIANLGFGLFAQYKDSLMSGLFSDDDLEKMQICSFVMGMAFMQSSTTIPHGMGYPLSHVKRVNHGIACAAFLGEYILSFKNRELVMPVVQACGFESAEAFAAYVSEIVHKNMHISVTDAEIEKWTDDFMKLDFRLASNPGQVFSREQLYNQVWDEHSAFNVDDVVKSQIRLLRQKLSVTGKDYIKNVWGVGYRFHNEPDDE